MKARVAVFWASCIAACSHANLDRHAVSGDHVGGVAVTDVPVKGATVRVDRRSALDAVPVELIAVDAGYVYVNSGTDWRKDTRAIPRSTIRQVVVEVYGSSAGKIGLWTAGGCASSATHGYFVVLTGPMWFVAGLTSMATAESRSRATAGPDRLDELYQYARFPQGMPRPTASRAAPVPAASVTAKAAPGLVSPTHPSALDASTSLGKGVGDAGR